MCVCVRVRMVWRGDGNKNAAYGTNGNDEGKFVGYKSVSRIWLFFREMNYWMNLNQFFFNFIFLIVLNKNKPRWDGNIDKNIKLLFFMLIFSLKSAI